ncbi:hypothetical protein DVH24_016295 [Malus domestica]|uniref:Uncharacterized protein n=1 Tax=Malus domestica TaxID=3750 RepID=A0A498HX47_MALDO|nr:hypothetical protein DVH24_016295 [Malus domestica]
MDAASWATTAAVAAAGIATIPHGGKKTVFVIVSLKERRFTMQQEKKKRIGEGLTTYPKPPPSHVIGLIREKFNEAQLGAFGATCFGHLQGVVELAFSRQLVHELSLRRVAIKGLKT